MNYCTHPDEGMSDGFCGMEAMPGKDFCRFHYHVNLENKVKALELEQVRHIEILKEEFGKTIKDLTQKLQDSESDWIKMRDAHDSYREVYNDALKRESELREKLKIATEALEEITCVRRLDGDGNEYEGREVFMARKVLEKITR